MSLIFRRALPLLPVVALALVLSSCSGGSDQPVSDSTMPSSGTTTSGSEPASTDTATGEPAAQPEESSAPAVLPGANEIVPEGVPVVPGRQDTTPAGNSGVNLPGQTAGQNAAVGGGMVEAENASAEFIAGILTSAFRKADPDTSKGLRLQVGELRSLIAATDLGKAWDVEAKGENIVFSRTNTEYKSKCTVEVPNKITIDDGNVKMADYLKTYVATRASCTRI
jgi:hypothetical protein